MTAPLWQSLPIDEASREALHQSGLDYRLVDTSEGQEFHDYLHAETRGFLGSEVTDEELASSREALAYRRTTGVYDSTISSPTWPVGTVNSWITELTLPGGRGIPLWSISGVTVAPTHRRKGIARALLEGELRTAADAGVALAGLTVSEATIYGRFGFAPAAFASNWSIETKRARWIGPHPGGRVDFIDRERLRSELPELHERVRVSQPGEVGGWPGLWRSVSGTAAGQEHGRKLRAVRYADEAGVTRGVAVYRLSEEGNDFSKHQLTLHYLLTETADAYAALWRFVLEHDLVTVVNAHLRSVDEPLRWMIADQRAATVTTIEHHWLRVLDVARALGARQYSAPGEFVLQVEDPLGFAEGTWMLRIDADGEARVEASTAVPTLTLGAAELAALLLGGVRAVTLHAAGRIAGEPEAVAALDRSFASAQTPLLGLWY